MKIVIFEPHPDDLLFGSGPIIFDWIAEGHEINVITVTDGCACFRKNRFVNMEEDDVAKMRIDEAKEAIKFLKIPLENLHLLLFHDKDGQKYVKDGIEKVKPLIKEANRLCLPSNHNGHIDHQATHDIVMGAAKALNLDIEYWIYFILNYGKIKKDSLDKQIEYKITDNLRAKLIEWLSIYNSQVLEKHGWRLFNRFLRRVKKVKYGIFKLEDYGKYYNF